jgi:hypothetical protein
MVESRFAKNLAAIEVVNRNDDRKWRVTDTIRKNDKDYVRFNSAMQLQRPGLLLLNGTIYSAFGARADQDPYHGWVFAHAADTLELKGVFCTSTNGQRAGIWQAGEGICADNEGNIYVSTGNGDIFPAAGCYGDCLLKLKLDDTGLQLVGFSNAFEELGKEDEDFGASSPTVLTDTGWMAGGGKDGHLYLFKQQAMDRLGSPDSVKQLFIASYDQESKRRLKKEDRDYTHHIHGSPVVYETGERQYLYLWGENDLLRAFQFDCHGGFPGQPRKKNREDFGKPDAVGDVFCSADPNPDHDSMHGGFLAVSANGRHPETGIVWASIPAFENASQSAVTGELRGYKAVDFIHYADGSDDSDENDDSDRADETGEISKAANLVQKSRLTALWSSQCNLERDDAGFFPKFCCPMVAKGRVYLPSFQGGGKLLVYGLLKDDDGGYYIGFGGKTNLVFNGSSCVRGRRVRLVERPHVYQAGSVFFKNRVHVRRFSTTFEFESILPDHFEDHQHPEQHGFVFAVQDTTVYALGEAGAGFGYGADIFSPLTRKRKIAKSIAIAFGLRNSVIEFYQNGSFLELPNVRPAGINLRGKASVTIAYDGAKLTVDLKDRDKGFQFHHEQPVDLANSVGAEAYVGFCGGSAEASGCTIDITKWAFNSGMATE